MNTAKVDMMGILLCNFKKIIGLLITIIPYIDMCDKRFDERKTRG